MIFFSDGQSFSSSKGGPTRERTETASPWNNRTWDLTIWNRWNHGAFVRLFEWWKIGIQGFVVLRGPIRSFTGTNGDSKVSPFEDSKSRNGDAGRKNPQRSHCCSGQRSQHWVSSFPTECIEIFAGAFEFNRTVQKKTGIGSQSNSLGQCSKRR